MAASGLSAELLAAHNRNLIERRATAPPNVYRNKKNLHNSLYRQATDIPVTREHASDQGSHKSSSIAEKSMSGRQSLSSVPRTNKHRVSSRWRHGKSCMVSVNGRDRSRTIVYENTYKTEPVSTQKFNVSATKEAVDVVLEERFGTLEEYDAVKCAVLCRTTSEVIKSKIKTLGFQRFKIVAHVIVGLNQGQGIHVASQGVWDTDRDNVISTIYEKKNFFVVATVFGTYFE